MRIWEVEDNKVVPSDLVREQDFILNIRRLHRLGTPTLVINIPLTAIEPGHGNRGPLEEAQERLQAFAKKSNGTYAEMSNGDVFLAWQENEATHVLPDWIMSVVLPGGVTPDDVEKFRLVYHLPGGYAELRGRANHYIDLSREASASAETSDGSASQLLQTESARGPLTAWGADQIEKLLKDIDLHRYLRTQAVCEYCGGSSPEALAKGEWNLAFMEIFMGINDLRQAHFPKMDIVPSEHLFLELCQTIDQRLLVELAERPDIITGHVISLNLSVTSISGAAFARFAHAVPRERHGAVLCELNCADLWQDFTMTLGVMESLRHEGFRVVIDGVTPEMLNYVNLTLFDADFIKINVSKDRVPALQSARARSALAVMPREKLIFYRCDSEQAFSAGLELGVTRFQGWLIDDLVKKR